MAAKYSIVKLLHLKEYNEKLTKQLIDKFKKEDRGAEEEQIRYRLGRFDQIKNGIAARLKRNALEIPERFVKPDKSGKVQNYLDITNWKYRELEDLIDAFEKTDVSVNQDMSGENTAKPEDDTNCIWNKGGMEIYSAPDKESCVKYSYEKGGTYSTCIGRKEEASNQYYDYRFGRGGEYRGFYFCFNRNQSSELKPGTDPKDRDYVNWYHMFVIHVSENGEKFGVTDAVNRWSSDGAHEAWPLTWDQMGAHMMKWGGESGKDSWNKIKKLKELFTYVAPSEKESDIAAVKGKTLNLEQFKKLSRNSKVYYINMKNPMTPEMMETLDVELKNLAINNQYLMPFHVLQNNLPLIKRYISIQFVRSNRPVGGEYLNYMNLVRNVQDRDLKKEYYEKYKDDAYLDYDLIAEHFPEYIREYLEQLISDRDFIPKSVQHLLTPEEKDLCYKYEPAYLSCVYDKTTNREQISYFFLIANKLTFDKFSGIDQHQRDAFCDYILELYSSQKLKEFPALLEVLPEIRIVNNDIQFKFKEGVYGRNVPPPPEELNERYILQKRAGIIK